MYKMPLELTRSPDATANPSKKRGRWNPITRAGWDGKFDKIFRLDLQLTRRPAVFAAAKHSMSLMNPEGARHLDT